MTDLHGERVVLRPLAPDDRPALLRVFAEPSVAERWVLGPGLEGTVDGLYEDREIAGFTIRVGGEVVGYIQYAEETDPDYRHASIDIAVIGPWQGQGIGPDAVRTLARHLVDARGHHRITIDPSADNERAIRAYAKVGFRPVGVMRQYERGADGTWHDGLLMDLLADEIR